MPQQRIKFLQYLSPHKVAENKQCAGPIKLPGIQMPQTTTPGARKLQEPRERDLIRIGTRHGGYLLNSIFGENENFSFASSSVSQRFQCR